MEHCPGSLVHVGPAASCSSSFALCSSKLVGKFSSPGLWVAGRIHLWRQGSGRMSESVSVLSNGYTMQATNVSHRNFKFSNNHIKKINKHYLALGLIGIKGKVQSFDWSFPWLLAIFASLWWNEEKIYRKVLVWRKEANHSPADDKTEPWYLLVPQREEKNCREEQTVCCFYSLQWRPR